jgi:ketosteroid isomerase-like protein
MPDDHLALVQSFFQLFFAGRVPDAVTLLEPTAEYRVPGKFEPAGVFVGPAAVAEHLEHFLDLTERPVNLIKWEDWLVGSENVACVVRLELQRSNRVEHVRLILLVQISTNNLISRVECFPSDEGALERFFSG